MIDRVYILSLRNAIIGLQNVYNASERPPQEKEKFRKELYAAIQHAEKAYELVNSNA